MSVFSEKIALVSPHVCLCDLGAEPRVLAGTLCDPAPAGVPGDIHHRAERPADSVGACFDRRDPRGLFDRSHIPGRRQSQWDREDGLVSVDDIHSEDQRNPVRAAFQRQLLGFPYFRRAVEVQDRADFVALDPLARLRVHRGTRNDRTVGWNEIRLADLLFDGHPAHQFVDESVHLRIRSRRCLVFAPAGHRGTAEQQKLQMLFHIDYFFKFVRRFIRADV